MIIIQVHKQQMPVTMEYVMDMH